MQVLTSNPRPWGSISSTPNGQVGLPRQRRFGFNLFMNLIRELRLYIQEWNLSQYVSQATPSDYILH